MWPHVWRAPRRHAFARERWLVQCRLAGAQVGACQGRIRNGVQQQQQQADVFARARVFCRLEWDGAVVAALCLALLLAAVLAWSAVLLGRCAGAGVLKLWCERSLLRRMCFCPRGDGLGLDVPQAAAVAQSNVCVRCALPFLARGAPACVRCSVRRPQPASLSGVRGACWGLLGDGATRCWLTIAGGACMWRCVRAAAWQTRFVRWGWCGLCGM